MNKESFLEGVEEWSNHRYLLWRALELTSNSNLPVCEWGCGDGSTKFLRSYCNINNREFISYENVKEWADKCESTLVDNWDSESLYKEYSVVLLDHAGNRNEAAAILKDKADIIVVHDSEFKSNGDYGYKKCWWLFKYKLHLEIGKTGATMLSNRINIVESIL